jgi:hypothetical protein
MTPSESTSRVLNSGDIRLLTEIGFLACGAGNTNAANTIFDGLRSACKDSSSALIGLAMSHLESGEADAAVTLLRSHHKAIKPDDHEYTVFYALCLLASGFRSEAERLLRDLLQLSDAGCPSHRLGAALLKNYLTDSRVVHVPEQALSQRTSKHLA